PPPKGGSGTASQRVNSGQERFLFESMGPETTRPRLSQGLETMLSKPVSVRGAPFCDLTLDPAVEVLLVLGDERLPIARRILFRKNRRHRALRFTRTTV